LRYTDHAGTTKNLFGSTLDVNKLKTERFIGRIWGRSYLLAQRQLEEVFCDFMGVYVFGQAFLHSFRYLIAPSLGEARSILYPRPRSRAEYMQEAAASDGLPTLYGFLDAFDAKEVPLPKVERFMVDIADKTTDRLHGQLLNIVRKYARKAEHFGTGSRHEESIEKNLRSLVPSASITSISAIVNAAWKLRLDIDNWDILGAMKEKDGASRRAEKLRILRDLVLKSFEVYEFRKRVEKNAP
jgi:hypothetical protein